MLGDIEVVVTEVHRSSVKLGINAPAGTVVVRAAGADVGPKPPLGATPRRIWEARVVSVAVMQRRVAELEAAVRRFRDAGREPYPEWLEELEEHLR